MRAVWDTGATSSVISQNTVKACGLKPIGITSVGHLKGVSQANVYYINMYLPNDVAASNLRVIQGELDDLDVLIGMDIIAMGDFAVTNPEGKTKFSFRLPSISDIDFISDTSINKILGRLTFLTIGIALGASAITFLQWMR